MRSDQGETWIAKRHAYLNADITEAWEPVGVLLDESEDDILEELRYDINFTAGEW